MKRGKNKINYQVFRLMGKSDKEQFVVIIISIISYNIISYHLLMSSDPR